MKIFDAEKIKILDQHTILHEPVASVDLMERAAQKVTDWLTSNCRTEHFAVFCGNGNNAGDGFAIARQLYQQGFEVDVFCDADKNFSADALINFKRAKEISGISFFSFDDLKNFPFTENTTIIDALFGTGLNRKISGKIAEVISLLNELKLHKVSVDIPSGLYADSSAEDNALIFNADQTLSFQFWKKSFLHPETGKYCGKVSILPIGLSEDFIQNQTTENYSVDQDFVSEIFQPRENFSHKGSFGKSVLVAGSLGKIGAAVLAVNAAMRSGSGITFAHAPDCGYVVLQSVCPEAMFISAGENFVSNFNIPKDAVCGIGPGLGTHPQTEAALKNFLHNYKKPAVLDADALNLIAQNPEYIELIAADSILTPHPKEFDRLFGGSKDSFERLEKAKEYSEKLGIIIVLKDHHTQTVNGNTVYYNLTGNSGMAKGGSGDALTGIITALLAQKYSSLHAAVLGVWIHGKAGDLAAGKLSKESMLASDLIGHLGAAFKALY